MKKVFTTFLMCVFFLTISLNIGVVYAFSPDDIEFHYQGKIFTYSLEKNIKTSSQFDLNYQINKYNRFGSHDDRIKLLSYMISIGIDKEIALNYLFPNLNKTITKIEKNLHIPAKNANLKINHMGKHVFKITPEIIGIDLDKDSLIDNMLYSFINHKPMSFALPIKKTIPKITQQHFEKFTNLRADFSTSISSSSMDRKHNIKNALASLNKIEVAPNEIFSFNKTVGRRTAENGYRSAKIIVNNEFVDGIGGGVCQVSSTLYNAALLAGLEIIEANKHSKQVGYVKSGFDAMVNFGSSDLKFKNNTSEKITIITNFSSSIARIRIFGENLNKTKYKLSNEIFNIVEPNEEILIDEKQEHLDKVKYEDEYFYLKTPRKGMEIKTYREKYVDNVLQTKELVRHDKFKVQNSVKVYGSQSRTVKQQEKSAEVVCA